MLFGAGGKIGVTVFVLISGYFLVKSSFTLFKLGRFLLQVWGYSLAAVAVAFCLHLPLGSEKELIRYLLPLGYMNWFAHSYLVLFLLCPFINKLLLRIPKSWFQGFLLFGFFLWYLLPTVADLTGASIHVSNSTTVRFIYIYSIGAYIRVYGEKIHVSYGLWKVAALYIAIVLLDALCHWLQVIAVDEKFWAFSYFGDMSSPLTLVVSLYLLLSFKQMKVSHSKSINSIAATTFGIYLIHDSNLLRNFIWQDLLQVKDWYNSPFFPLYAVVMVLLVFSVCGFIDFLRFKYLEPRYSRWVDRLVAKIEGSRFWARGSR